MTKHVFDQIMESVNEIVAVGDGTGDAAAFRIHTVSGPDVAAIRKRTGLSQVAFARRFGFSPGAVRDWEQGRKPPEPTARVLLTVIDREPEAVTRALGSAPR